jgi:hypothetical protein
MRRILEEAAEIGSAARLASACTKAFYRLLPRRASSEPGSIAADLLRDRVQTLSLLTREAPPGLEIGRRCTATAHDRV